MLDILQRLQDDKVEARKNGDKPTLDSIDFILTDLSSKRARLKVLTIEDLSEEDVIKSIKKERDAHEEILKYTNDTVRIRTSVDVINYLDSLLPTPLPLADIEDILRISGLLAVEPKDIGASMKKAKEIFENSYVDMSVVSSLVRGS